MNSITQLTVQNFATWQTAEFTPTQQGTPNFTGPANTPFNDLVPNLLKYVFNINPSRPMSNADRAALPIVKTTTTSGTTTATYTFRKYAKLIDATATVQTSTDCTRGPLWPRPRPAPTPRPATRSCRPRLFLQRPSNFSGSTSRSRSSPPIFRKSAPVEI